MFHQNKTISINGTKYRLTRKLGFGSFGEVWLAKRHSDGKSIVVKRFREFDENEVPRLEALREFDLPRRIPGAASVSIVIYPQGRGWSGYTMPWAAGVNLNDWLQKDDFNLLDNNLIAIQMAKLFGDTHYLGIAHGDVHPHNIKVCLHNDVPVVSVIDWDNANLPGLPPPRSPGMKAFLSPEAMEAFLKGNNYAPDIKTEQSSVAKIFHWLFFGREAFHATNDREFENGIVSGSWNSDPSNGPVDTEAVGGITNQWVSPEIADLFRRGLGRGRDARPSMPQWQGALLKIVKQGFSLCDTCRGPVLPAPRSNCPYCGNPFPTLAVVSTYGHRFVANGQSVLIGQTTLPSPGISGRHAIITKLGPETYITDLGSKNGTYRWAKNRWMRLPARQRSPIAAGDLLLCGNVRLQVVTS